MRALIMFLVTAVVLFPLTANAIDVSGDQWGTWTKDNSPYNVVGEIRVPPESTLVIEPGIVVDFQGHYKFIVDSLATLLAIGTESHSIYFTTEDSATGWNGIRFIYADSNSQVSYCRLEYGKGFGSYWAGGVVYCLRSSPTISHNTIRANSAGNGGGGIYCESCSPTIRNNAICDNSADGVGGGICCFESNPTISDNTISGNSAYTGWGGGIYCSYSTPTISNNTITGNSADSSGGGIYCYSSSPTISNNTISGNSASGTYGEGGGICCYCSSPTITNNTISGDSAWSGGAIYCSESSPTISNNTISANLAWSGAGLMLESRCDPTISNNTISGNSAGRQGGGIYCGSYCDPTIRENSISGNSAEEHGGGIYCYNSSPTITNTILWEDTAPQGPEIYVESGNPTVTYSDVKGGWPGGGNINADPLFVDPQGGDFHLQWGSPCIDAGDPNSPPDPDGTRADMGALHFHQGILFSPHEFAFNLQLDTSAEKVLSLQSSPVDTVSFCLSSDADWISFLPDSGYLLPDSSLEVSVTFDGSGLPLGPNEATIFLHVVTSYHEYTWEIPVNVHIFSTDYTYISLTPDSLPILIPPEGGSFSYWAHTYNATDFTYRFDVLIDATLPGGQTYGPIYKKRSFGFKPQQSIGYHLGQSVPGLAPAGEYSYNFKMGVLPDQVDFQDSFTFTKLGSGSSLGRISVTSWDLVGWGEEFVAHLGQAQDQTAFMPTEYSLSQNYPNPFNATTVIEYALPIESHVKLQVYNIRGQKVATLVDSKQQAGCRSVSWDASGVSSGLYFYRLTAGSKVFSERMMLLK